MRTSAVRAGSGFSMRFDAPNFMRIGSQISFYEETLAKFGFNPCG
jgi:hypothetical protein